MTRTTVDVPRHGQWQVVIVQDADRAVYESHCPMLDIYSSGPTHAHALAAITSAIGMWIEICADRGGLGAELAKRGTVH